MRFLTPDEMKIRTLNSLGFDPNVYRLESIEVLSCILRRTASYICPCTHRILLNSAITPLTGLVNDPIELQDKMVEVLDNIIAYGDLLEQKNIIDENEPVRTLIYLSPPMFVKRESGAVLLLGVPVDDVALLPRDLEKNVERKKHIRQLFAEDLDDLALFLRELGYIELNMNTWLKPPRTESYLQCINRIDSMLDVAPPSGSIENLRIIEPTTSVCYYKGRWSDSGTRTGRYIARREQKYGADLWCYVELENGIVVRLVDLPLRKNRWRGCDEAWRLQAAIDAMRGKPQKYRLVDKDEEFIAIEVFSPVPSWVTRRWDIVGEKLSAFSYLVNKKEVEEETEFLRQNLWLVEDFD